MAIEVNDGFQVNAPRYADMRAGKLVAGRSVPYASIAEALASIPVAYRCEGFEFFIKENGRILKCRFTGDFAFDEYTIIGESAIPEFQDYSAVDKVLSNNGQQLIWTNQKPYIENLLLGELITERLVKPSSQIDQVAYGAGLYVAFNNSASTMKGLRSNNLRDWQEFQFPLSGLVVSIFYVNALFIATFSGAGANIATSFDGINWEIKSTGSHIISAINIFYSDGFYLFIADSCYRSADLISYSRVLFLSGLDNTNSAAIGRGKVVIIGAPGSFPRLVSYSEDNGLTWQNSPAPDKAYKICYGNGKFLAFTDNNFGSGAHIWWSEDLVTWTEVALNYLGSSVSALDIAFERGEFWLLSSFGLFKSKNGIFWEKRTIHSYLSNSGGYSALFRPLLVANGTILAFFGSYIFQSGIPGTRNPFFITPHDSLFFKVDNDTLFAKIIYLGSTIQQITLSSNEQITDDVLPLTEINPGDVITIDKYFQVGTCIYIHGLNTPSEFKVIIE